MFDRKGQIIFPTEGNDFDAIFEAALEAGAEDVKEENDVIEVITEPNEFETVKRTPSKPRDSPISPPKSP